MGLLDPTGTLPEPAEDLAAQLAAIADPASTKSTMFLAAGSPEPAELPAGAAAARRPDGTLISTDPVRLARFAGAGRLTDADMAGLLDYPQSKAGALAGGDPVVVQAISRHVRVVQEHAASQSQIPAATRAALRMVPGGRVRIGTPQAAIRRRLAGLLGG
jgi:hypothetical protein